MAIDAQESDSIVAYRHFKIRINQGFRMPRGLWSGRKDETVGWVGKIGAICRSQGESVRRVETHGRAVLRKHRLKQPAVKDAIAAADRSIAGTARQPRDKATLPTRAIGEAKPRLDIILVGVESVVDAFLDFARSAHIFVACAKIKRERSE